jgi:hypothetical protein
MAVYGEMKHALAICLTVLIACKRHPFIKPRGLFPRWRDQMVN